MSLVFTGMYKCRVLLLTDVLSNDSTEKVPAFAGMTNPAFAGMTNPAFAGMTNPAFAGMTGRP